MLTAEQIEAAQNAADDSWVQVRFAFVWPSSQHMAAREMYHVVNGNGHYNEGSTVTLKTLLEHGLRVEVVQ